MQFFQKFRRVRARLRPPRKTEVQPDQAWAGLAFDDNSDNSDRNEMLDKETRSPQFPEKGAGDGPGPGKDGPEAVSQNGTRPEAEGWSTQTHMVHAPGVPDAF